jgi:hypothetical protein
MNYRWLCSDALQRSHTLIPEDVQDTGWSEADDDLFEPGTLIRTVGQITFTLAPNTGKTFPKESGAFVLTAVHYGLDILEGAPSCQVIELVDGKRHANTLLERLAGDLMVRALVAMMDSP